MDSENFKLPVGGRADSAVFSGTGNWYRKNLTGVRVSFSLPLRRTCLRCDADAAQLPATGPTTAAPSGWRRTDSVEHDD